jgi:hypothetical protein
VTTPDAELAELAARQHATKEARRLKTILRRR